MCTMKRLVHHHSPCIVFLSASTCRPTPREFKVHERLGAASTRRLPLAPPGIPSPCITCVDYVLERAASRPSLRREAFCSL
ncbi:hypothetical protein E2C01_018536 [Portunus trituberculatus]|uniref:Uncharacterized protein n=1 Tax=Portunus trituberculatus TaxID=210409 RepID=A0A5B7DXA6_PORTR|nr:hypothetical protein [Portunus trituberculatus]